MRINSSIGNKITTRYWLPIPSMDELLYPAAWFQYFFKIDFHRWYHQIQMQPGNVRKPHSGHDISYMSKIFCCLYILMCLVPL